MLRIFRLLTNMSLIKKFIALCVGSVLSVIVLVWLLYLDSQTTVRLIRTKWREDLNIEVSNLAKLFVIRFNVRKSFQDPNDVECLKNCDQNSPQLISMIKNKFLNEPSTKAYNFTNVCMMVLKLFTNINLSFKILQNPPDLKGDGQPPIVDQYFKGRKNGFFIECWSRKWREEKQHFVL